jgi:hypothetical protein
LLVWFLVVGGDGAGAAAAAAALGDVARSSTAVARTAQTRVIRRGLLLLRLRREGAAGGGDAADDAAARAPRVRGAGEPRAIAILCVDRLARSSAETPRLIPWRCVSSEATGYHRMAVARCLVFMRCRRTDEWRRRGSACVAAPRAARVRARCARGATATRAHLAPPLSFARRRPTSHENGISLSQNDILREPSASPASAAQVRKIRQRTLPAAARAKRARVPL